MILRQAVHRSHDAPVPQYDSYSFGKYGGKCRIYRLRPGGSFYIEYEGGKRRKAIRPRITDTDRALDYLHAFYRDYSRGVDAFAAGKVGVDTVLQAYVLDRLRRVSASEQKADARRLAMFSRRFRGRVSTGLVLDDWEAFAEDRATGKVSGHAVRPRTVVADLQWLRGALAWASKRRWIPENPLRGYPLPRDPNPRRPVASQDRYERLLATILPLEGTVDECGRRLVWPAELRAILALTNGTGRRLSAVLHLKAADLLLDEKPHGAIRWRAEWDKGKRDRVVPMNQTVRAEIDRYRKLYPKVGDVWLFPSRRHRKKNRPLSRSGAARMLNRAEELAGLSHLDGSLWHAYRRKWATERKHLPAVDVAAAGGWKNVRTLQTVYQQPDPSGMLRVVMEPVELREQKS